jgi:coenzyme Q-binding protein COQ10
MPSFRTQRRVRHSSAEMFALVADVEAYPQFVPMCQKLKVLRRDLDENGDERLMAQMEVGYKAIRESFTSRVTLRKASSEIIVEYVDGPFRRMRNEWRFVDEGPAASTVEFFIDYEFKNRILAALMGAMFETAFRRFSQAFEERADVVYGRAGPQTGAG